jgi:hypothetical protein
MDFLKHNRFALHLLMGFLLTIIYPMQDLFSGNQNVYFLWGMADLLPIAFEHDPLLNSPDPYPVFSWLISVFPVQFIGIWTTLIYVLLNAVYSFSLFGLADQIANIYRLKSRLISFATIFLVLHTSPIWGTYFNLVSGSDLRWVWDSGIAEQGVLRGYLQPSVFGVFLLLSFYLATRKNFTTAILAVAPAVMIHANYLFLGGILTLLYLIKARFEKKTFLASILLFTAVLPYAIYLTNNFLFLDNESTAAIAQSVMEGYDSNIHINPANWLNEKLFIQLFVLFLGLMLVWQTSWRNLFASVLGVVITLTVLAYATGNTTLISLNPWRFSVLLIPVAVSVTVAKFVSGSFLNEARRYYFPMIMGVCMSLVYFRIFGNSSEEFASRWDMINWGCLVVPFVLGYLVFGKPVFSRFLEPLVIISLVVVGFTEMRIQKASALNTEQFQAIESVKREEPNTIYIIPPNWTSFRMNATKAVYVDENLVYGPALPEIANRLTHVNDAFKSGSFDQIVTDLPEEIRVKVVAPSNAQISNALSSDKITESYSLYSLRE